MAAEGFLFDTAGRILEILASLAVQEIGLACCMKDEFDKLKGTVKTIEAVLRNAEEEQRKKNQEVIVWLQRLKDAFYEADDLLEDFSTEIKRRRAMSGCETTKEVRIFFSKSNHIAYSDMMARKIKNIRKKLDVIKNDRQFHLSEHHHEKVDNTERETHSFVCEEKVIGRDDDKNAIIRCLLRDEDNVENVSVIPIVGIGGVGKTTLTKFVYNDENVKNHFELKMWVCVSYDFNLKVIVEKIIKSATLREPQNLEFDQLQKCLFQEINGKKYLLVLDDIWNENLNKWNELKDLLKNGAKGSMILVTTRTEKVAKITSKVRPYYLEGLPKEKSWSLFKQIAFEQGEEPKNSRLVPIGEEIVAKCAGVPLAIKTIGRLLYHNSAVEEWLHFRDSELSKIDQEETDILPILRLSYDHLPSCLKQCFAYCAVFPKGYDIEKEKLIYLWMAQGFVQTINGNRSPEDLGNRCFEDLLSRSFFQVDTQYRSRNNETLYKMHNLMHDLAQSVMGTECTIATLYTSNIDERCRHLSLCFNLEPWEKNPDSLLRAKQLRTFLLPFRPHVDDQEYSKKACGICVEIFPTDSRHDFQMRQIRINCLKILSNFRRLRTLDLSHLQLTKLPKSIEKLKHLRYLDLSNNQVIEKLPNSMSRLVNLEILDLFHCSELRKLPKDFRITVMISLRRLVIEGCVSLPKLPAELQLLTKPRTTSPL